MQFFGLPIYSVISEMNPFNDPADLAGRMSLTVYLTQTLVMTTVFYGYGLGLYGSVPVWMMLPLAVSLFAVQMVTAHWWMRHFTMGPLEWLWRAATYGYLPALRK